MTSNWLGIYCLCKGLNEQKALSTELIYTTHQALISNARSALRVEVNRSHLPGSLSLASISARNLSTSQIKMVKQLGEL